MDFGSLLQVAQKNENKQESKRFYQTKFSAPKKETKQAKNLSDNIKKFMAKKAEEEKHKALEEKLKKEKLLAMRDQKAQNRINKHLKVCKSANKSVIADAVDNENTAVTLAGPSQCDEDDYGYVSQEASAFYDKLMNKYSSLPPEKSIFKDDGKKTVKDIASTKDRVKQALKQQQLEESLPHKRKRKHKETDDNDAMQESNDRKNDREVEKEKYGEPKKEEKPKPKKKPIPPPIDFTQLLKLAETKQHEPVKIVPKVKEEPERLMTKKQMKEFAMLKEWKERKEQRIREPEKSAQSSSDNNNPSKSSASRDSKPLVKTPVDVNREKTVLKTLPSIKKISDRSEEKSNNLNKLTERNSVVNRSQNNYDSNRPTDRINGVNKNVISTANRPVHKSNSVNKSSSSKATEKDVIAEERKKLEEERRQLEEMRRSIEEEKKKLLLSKNKKGEESKSSSITSLKSTGTKTKDPVKPSPSLSKNSSLNSVKSRPFPPTDVKPRQFPPADIKPRQFPPPDVRSSKQKEGSSKLKINKRRLVDDEDDEYDSELDDFIDDGPQDDGENYSKYITEIFGYDRNKYRDIDDEDDLAMESNFTQQLKEEIRSRKIGMLEDLEDIKREKLENQRKKQMKKKRRAE